MKKILFSTSLFALVAGFANPAAASMEDQIFGAGRKIFSYYSQDPTVADYGVSKGSLPNDFQVTRSYIKNGLFKITLPASDLQKAYDAKGNFVFDPAKSPDAFLAGHTFFLLSESHNRMGADLNFLKSNKTPSAGLNEALKLWDVAMNERTEVFPKKVTANVNQLNAWYQRLDTATGSDRSLTFLYSGKVLTAESSDIVRHELGHELTDKIRPTFYDSHSDETGALHEWSGDAFAFFNALTDFDVVQNVVMQTGGNLHLKNDAGSLAESFGKALKMKTGALRDADQDIDVTHAGKEVHELSVVGMGAMYDTFAAVTKTAFLSNYNRNKDLDLMLLETAAYMRRLWVATLVEIPVAEPTLADVGLTFQRVSQDYKFPNGYSLENMEWGKIMHDEMVRRGVNMTPSGASAVFERKPGVGKGICGRTFNIVSTAAGSDSDSELTLSDAEDSERDEKVGDDSESDSAPQGYEEL